MRKPTPARIRIVTDGSPASTRVYVNGKFIEGVLEVSYELSLEDDMGQVNLILAAESLDIDMVGELGLAAVDPRTKERVVTKKPRQNQRVPGMGEDINAS